MFLQFCIWSTEKDEENSWVVSLQNNKDENKWWPQLYKGLQAGNRWKANIQLLLGRICQRANYRRTSFTNTRDASFKLHLYCRVSISEGRLPLWRGWLRWGGRSRSVAKNVNAVITWYYISNQQFRSLIQLSGCQCSQKYQVTLIFFSGQPEETVVMARPQFITEPLTMMVNEGDVIRWSTWSWSWRIWWWW